MPRIAAVVTTRELSEFFTGDRGSSRDDPSSADRWVTKVNRRGEFEATCKDWTVLLAPKGIKYRVSIEANDDPSDSDEGLTDDPVEFIADFMGSGGDYFRKMSSGPEEAARALRSLAVRIKVGSTDPGRADRKLRRALAAVACAMRVAKLGDFERMLNKGGPREEIPVHEVEKDYVPSEPSRRQEEAHLEAVDKLVSEMRSKGWDVKTGTSDAGMPVASVDVGGQYTATVAVDSMTWDFHFDLRGTGLKREGLTQDPIEEWKKLARSDEAKEAKAARGSAPKSGGGGGGGHDPDQETVKPARRQEPAETARPGSRS